MTFLLQPHQSWVGDSPEKWIEQSAGLGRNGLRIDSDKDPENPRRVAFSKNAAGQVSIKLTCLPGDVANSQNTSPNFNPRSQLVSTSLMQEGGGVLLQWQLDHR